MRIVITGHTKGLGKALYDYFSTNHSVTGYSRSNGYDLNRFSDTVVEKSLDSDIFINNAYVEYYQNYIFDSLVEKWKDDESKTIVNIGSKAKFASLSKYANDKKTLSFNALKSCLNNKLYKCRIVTCNIGPIQTGVNENLEKALPLKDCVDILSWVIMQPQHIEIGEISFWALDDT